MVEAKKEITPEEMERGVAQKYQQLSAESKALLQRLVELEDEKKENE